MANPTKTPSLADILCGTLISVRSSVLILLVLLFSLSVYSQTVYITRTGQKYHDDGCRYLSRSKIETTLAEAKNSGYTACSVCSPPTSVTSGQGQKQLKTQPIRSVTSTQCTASTKTGRRCLRMTTNANGRCWQH